MSDYGHEQTDKELKRVEDLISKEYAQSAEELEKKMMKHFSDFSRKDAEKQKELKSGIITEQRYNEWKIGQLAIGQRWKDARDSMTDILVNADKNAAAIIQGNNIKAYGDNMNYGTYEVEHGSEINTGFTLYDEETVRNLLKEDPKLIPMPKVDIPKDELWNRQKLTSAVTQGILQGESIDKIAKRLWQVADMDKNAAIRNARTYTTAAENKGRLDSYERAEKLGIKTNKKWIATLDDRTRVEHRHLDNMVVAYDKDFEVDGYMISYPGDPSAEPEMIYNCRCTLVADIEGIDYKDERNDSKLGDMTYEEWKHAKDKPGTEVPEPVKEEQPKAAEPEQEEKPAQEEKAEPEFEFTPANTIAEAEEYAKTFCDDKQFGALGISYKGIGLDVANEINATIAEFYNKYDVKEFGGVFVPKGNTKLGQTISGAHAAYSPVRNSFLVNNKCKSIALVEKELAEEKSVIKNFFENPDNYDTSKMRKRVYEILKNSAESGRGTVPDTVRDMVNHELGHSLEKQIKSAENYEKIINNMKEFAPKISGYSTESFSEYIAESFCSYQKGEEIVDEELIKAFKALERK